MSAASLFYVVEVPDEGPADEEEKPTAKVYAEARTRRPLVERADRLNARHKPSWPFHYEVLGAHAARRLYQLVP
jgi:hypothetical protein